ncbi:MAG: UDP-N-acetylglucosamine 2-epimerase (non-hydrolyzing) [Planctomycetes bacterium]|nr:UDP-N-acetylglucosamine 2-epimerase (non-hydrolyzing) [Planctomycetota bacterium]
MPLKLMLVAGARPNFMKVAPLLWEIQRRDNVDALLVHTGQHYDEKMSQQFFTELNIPRPDENLEVGSGSHAVQTAEVMKRFEPVLQSHKPDAVVVVGDVNSTLACALTAVKLGVPVAHVEAGLRSFDRSMPEEVNRILTDAISTWLFVSEPSGAANLRAENVPGERVHFAGNVMIDTLIACTARIAQSTVLDRLAVKPREYAVLTMHRPANVDRPEVFAGLMRAIARLQRELPFVFPVHPRTRQALGQGEALPNLLFTEPLGYLDFMKLVGDARFVLTDSGGVQEETTYLGVPCLTMRENTERPVTVAQGTNRLVGLDPGKIVAEGLHALAGCSARHVVPELWDGQAARRILDVLTPHVNRPAHEPVHSLDAR